MKAAGTRRPGDMPRITEIFDDGYSETMVKTLLRSIEAYGIYMAHQGIVPDEEESNDIINLVWLVRAILSDCHGMNL